MTDISSAQIGAVTRSSEPEFRDYVALLKPLDTDKFFFDDELLDIERELAEVLGGKAKP